MASDDQLSEPVRNRLLRRVDWRFLLPNPYPRVSICFSGDELARALALVSGELVERDRSSASSCDLAVAVNPDGATLREAWTALIPGGICYSEWYSPTALGTRGVRRRLQAAGFTDVTCYWAWPWPLLARTRFWIPLEARGALNYFLGSRPPVPNRFRRFARVLGRSLLTLVTLRIVPFPVCAVARKPTPGAPSTSVSSMPATRYLPELGIPSTNQSWLMLTGGTRTIHKVVGLVFSEPESRPRAIVKWPRVPEAIHLLEKEAESLTRVHRLRVGGIDGVPRVLFCNQSEGGFALGETALTGAPLYTQLHRGNARTLALEAANWLGNLAGEQPPEPRLAAWKIRVEPIFAEFESMFGHVLEPGPLRKTRSILQTLDGCPLVYEHRDFSPWNILVAPTGELAVLDWEGAEPHGLPLLDLLYFLAHLGFFLDGAYASQRFRESYRTSLDPSTLTGSIRAQVVEHYQRRLHLDPALVAPLRVFVWLVHARSEFQRLVADSTGELGPEQLRRAGFVALWEEELSSISQAGR